MRYSILLFFLILFAGFASAQAPAPVGVQLYSFRKQLADDVPGTLQKVKDMGFTYVETAGFYGMTVQEFRKLLDSYGLRVASTDAEFAALEDPAQLATIIDNAKALGSEFVTCFWIPHNGDEFTADDVQRAAKLFNTAGKTLRDNGLGLLYHPHGYEFRPHGDGYLFDLLVRETDPQYVNFEMDVFWVHHPGQSPVAWMKKYPDRWKAMHLKDRRPGTPGNQNGEADVESNVVLGTGDVNIAPILKQARKIGVKHYFIEDESSRSLEQVPASVAYLRKKMK